MSNSLSPPPPNPSSSQAPTITDQKPRTSIEKNLPNSISDYDGDTTKKSGEVEDLGSPSDEKTQLEKELKDEDDAISNTGTRSGDLERQPSTYEDESRFLKGKDLFLVFVGMLLSVFLVALDQTIVAPALPVIASKFDALSRIGWIASSYFLTQSGFMLLYGSILSVFDRKWVFIFAVSLFELGSLFCAVAWTVNFLIFARAVAGVGAAGIFVSCLSIIAEVTRLEQRPMFFGAFGAVFAFSSVVGPLLGGTFTSHVSWRWCFYINLPIGAITIVCILLIIKSTKVPPTSQEVIDLTERRFGFIFRAFGKKEINHSGLLFRLLTLDIFGVVIMLGVVTTLLLPLQWGGNTYPWNDKRIIALFCTFGVVVTLFVLYEHKYAGPNRILPLNFFRSKTQIGCCLMSFFVFFTMMVFIYYLPLQYQAVKGHSAEKSGIDILPFMLGVVIFSGLSGAAITMTGHYWTILLVGPMILSVGGGLFYTTSEYTSNGKLIGFQFIISCGVGMVLQNLIIAIQANVAKESDVPLATSLVTFFQLIGAVVGISIAGTIFGNELGSGLKKYAPSAPYDLVRNDVLSIYTLPKEEIPGVVHAYVKALDYVYVVSVGLGVAASLSVLLIKNVNIKGRSVTAGAHVA